MGSEGGKEKRGLIQHEGRKRGKEHGMGGETKEKE